MYSSSGGNIVALCGGDIVASPESVNTTNIGMKKHGDSGSKTKRSRASYHHLQNPCCQVEGCKLDLTSAKDYHRRHRICENHSKSPKVIVAGMERRFCQQCSRFHDLSEFDDKKRSCRRRLSDHNARRRKVQPDSIQLSSAFCDRRPEDVLLNGLIPVSLSNTTWENANSSMLRQGRDSFTGPSKAGGGLEGTFYFPNLHTDSDTLFLIQSSNPDAVDPSLMEPTTNCLIGPDLLGAHSPLSSSSWEESALMEGLVNGHHSPHYFSLLPTSYITAEQQSHVSLLHSSLNLHQEFHLF